MAKKKKFNQRLRELDQPKGGAGKAGGPPIPGRALAAEEPPVELAAFIMFAFVGLLVLIALAVLFGVRNVQEDIETRATNALAANGITDVEVSASGLDVRIVGVVDAEEKLELAASIPARLRGVGQVDASSVQFIPPLEARDIVVVSEPLDIEWEDSSATVTGTLSTQAVVDAFAAAIAESFSTVDATNLVVLEGLDDESDWLPTIQTVVRKVAGSNPVGRVIVNPSAGIVTVSAEYETRQQQRDIRDEVEDDLANVTFVFSSGLTVKDAPRVTREEVVQAQATLDELIEGKVVEFEFGSAVITPVGQALLDELLDAMRQFPNVPIEIGGHTDDVGTPESNLELSRERADAVLAYLVARGEDPVRFVVVGYGETVPIADNATDEGRARNRRIEFVAIYEEPEAEGES